MGNKFAASLQKMEKNTKIENQGNQDMPRVVEPPESKELEDKIANSPITLDVGSVIDNLATKDRKGRSITLYLKNEVLEQLEKISKQKNISKSQIISVILEKTLLNSDSIG